MLALLREVEWKGATAYDDGDGHTDVLDGGCPACGAFGLAGGGHRADCRLAAFLR